MPRLPCQGRGNRFTHNGVLPSTQNFTVACLISMSSTVASPASFFLNAMISPRDERKRAARMTLAGNRAAQSREIFGKGCQGRAATKRRLLSQIQVGYGCL